MIRNMLVTTCLACLVILPVGSADALTYAYVPSYGDGNVVRINTEDETLSTVAFDDNPYGAAVTPQGDYLVLTRPGADSATVVRTGSFPSTAAQVQIDVGDDPRGVAIESRGEYAYVANYGTDKVSEIYIPTLSITDTIDVGDGPWGVAAYYDEVDESPKVYVSNNLDDSISVISDDGVQTITGVGGGPLGLALTPDGTYLYVALYDAGQVAIYQTSDRSQVKTIDVGNGPWGVAIGSDGAYVYVTNSLDDTVTVIDAGSQTLFDSYNVGDLPLGVACPKNGDFAFVINQADDSISKIDIENDTVSLVDGVTISGAYGLGAFIGGTPPNAPSGLSAVKNDNNNIELSWNDNSSDELGFKIERRKDTADRYVQTATVGAGVTTYTNSGLQDNTSYQFRVRAFNEAADSDYADAAEAITAEHEGFSWCFIQSMFR
jgi:YVTN family beta-propeller protein